MQGRFRTAGIELGNSFFVSLASLSHEGSERYFVGLKPTESEDYPLGSVEAGGEGRTGGGLGLHFVTVGFGFPDLLGEGDFHAAVLLSSSAGASQPFSPGRGPQRPQVPSS